MQEGANWNPIAGAALYIGGVPGITLGNTVYLRSGTYQADFSKAGVGPRTQSILVHEIGHVWQKQTNPAYSEIKAGAESWFESDTYGYELSPSNPGTMAGPMKPLASYEGFEPQAQIIQDYFLVSRGQEPWGNRNTTGVDPSDLLAGYEQTIVPSGLGPQAYTPPSNSSPGDRTLPSFTEPVPGGRPK